MFYGSSEDCEYFAQATVGTEFFYGIRSRWHDMRLECATVVTVERETKTQLILSNGKRVSRKNGDVVGSDYEQVIPCTAKNVEARSRLIEEAKARQVVKAFKERLEKALDGKGESIQSLADRLHSFDHPELPPIP